MASRSSTHEAWWPKGVGVRDVRQVGLEATPDAIASWGFAGHGGA